MKVKYILSVGAAIFCLLLASNKAIGQSPKKDVQITSDQASVQFTDDSPDAFMVEIGGPGNYYFKKTVEDTRNITIGTIGKGGKVFPDGIYKMQVTPIFSLTPEQREELSRLRANDDDEGIAAFRAANNLPKNVETLVINFSIQEGKFIPPDQKEGRINLPTTSSRWELDHPALYASINPKELDYGSRVTDQTNMVEDDQVFADDVIVQGSLCVGFDCVNNESFGFDTIRLKENNTRIKFEDTSVGTFPSTDWQLTANDSASGGANRFSIEDVTAGRIPFTIEGGAPTNALYVDDSGRIGLRTATPVLDLHILTGNSPAIRLDQSSASGFTAQTWDVAGNEANFFVRDVTNGSKLSFRIRPGAPSSSIDVSSTGNVGIGTASPQTKLAINQNVLTMTGDYGTYGLSINTPTGVGSLAAGTDDTYAFIQSFSAKPLQINNLGNNILLAPTGAGRVGIGTLAPNFQLELSTNSAAKPGSNTWTVASDKRLKTDILDYTDGLEKILKIKPVKYHYNGKLGMPTDKEYVGVIAQEMMEIAPYTVSKLNPENNDYLAYDGSAVTYMLVNAVKEQQATIEAQQQEIAKLKNELADLAALKQAVAELAQLVKGGQQQGAAASVSQSTVSEKE